MTDQSCRGRLPDSIDAHVGLRLRQRRELLGVTQEELSAHLGITQQQIQKYESGENRMSVGRLYKVAKYLKVPFSVFFDGLDEEQASADDLARPDVRRLLNNYLRIADRAKRKLVGDLTTLLASEETRADRSASRAARGIRILSHDDGGRPMC